jgi:hypothetical protein
VGEYDPRPVIEAGEIVISDPRARILAALSPAQRAREEDVSGFLDWLLFE